MHKIKRDAPASRFFMRTARYLLSMNTNPSAPPPDQHASAAETRVIVITLAVVGGALVLAGLVFGEPITKIAVVLIALTSLQGAWRGAIETIGFAVALLLSALLAFPLGRMIEDTVASAAGVGGLTKRSISVGVAAIAVLLVTAIAASIAGRSLKKKSYPWMRHDHLIGAGLGLAEGLLIVMLVVWGLTALEPIARNRLAQAQADHEADPSVPESHALAQAVVSLGESASRSAFGSVAAIANPIANAGVIQLADDYMAVALDREALAHFLESDAARELQDHPAVQRALQQLREDPEIRTAIEGGLGRDGLRAILNSDTVLSVIDESELMRELGPMINDLQRAMDEAKKRIRGR